MRVYIDAYCALRVAKNACRPCRQVSLCYETPSAGTRDAALASAERRDVTADKGNIIFEFETAQLTTHAFFIYLDRSGYRFSNFSNFIIKAFILFIQMAIFFI